MEEEPVFVPGFWDEDPDRAGRPGGVDRQVRVRRGRHQPGYGARGESVKGRSKVQGVSESSSVLDGCFWVVVLPLFHLGRNNVQDVG